MRTGFCENFMPFRKMCLNAFSSTLYFETAQGSLSLLASQFVNSESDVG